MAWYQEIYSAENGTPIDEIPTDVAPLVYHQLVVYTQDKTPQFIDIDGKRYALTLTVVLSDIDMD